MRSITSNLRNPMTRILGIAVLTAFSMASTQAQAVWNDCSAYCENGSCSASGDNVSCNCVGGTPVCGAEEAGIASPVELDSNSDQVEMGIIYENAVRAIDTLDALAYADAMQEVNIAVALGDEDAYDTAIVAFKDMVKVVSANSMNDILAAQNRAGSLADQACPQTDLGDLDVSTNGNVEHAVGGCSTTGGGAAGGAMLLGLAALLTFGRRRRAGRGLAVAALALTMGGLATPGTAQAASINSCSVSCPNSSCFAHGSGCSCTCDDAGDSVCVDGSIAGGGAAPADTVLVKLNDEQADNANATVAFLRSMRTVEADNLADLIQARAYAAAAEDAELHASYNEEAKIALAALDADTADALAAFHIELATTDNHYDLFEPECDWNGLLDVTAEGVVKHRVVGCSSSRAPAFALWRLTLLLLVARRRT